MEFNATFIATIFSFIVFVLLMNKILYAPILNIIEERKNYINNNYQNANENDEQSKTITNIIEEKKTTAKDDARVKYTETIDEYKTRKTQVVLEAQAVAREQLENSNIELTNLSNETKESLKHSMIDLANDIVEKIIGYKPEVQGFNDSRVNEILYK